MVSKDVRAVSAGRLIRPESLEKHHRTAKGIPTRHPRTVRHPHTSFNFRSDQSDDPGASVGTLNKSRG